MNRLSLWLLPLMFVALPAFAAGEPAADDAASVLVATMTPAQGKLEQPVTAYGIVPQVNSQLNDLLLAAIADPVRKLSSVFTRLQSGCAAADRVFAYLDRQPAVRSNAQGPRLARLPRDHRGGLAPYRTRRHHALFHRHD